MKFTKTYEVLEIRYSESHTDRIGDPNSTYHAGDDYGGQFDYSIKTAKEMLKFLELKAKYDRNKEPLKLTRWTVETVTED